jgi:succinylglutamate desuccinylase
VEIDKFNKDGFLEMAGKKPGPTSVILAGVHGNEPHGIRAFDGFLPILRATGTDWSGRVLFGVGNPRALAQSQRKTDEDLNRLFRQDEELTRAQINSYEYERAQVLKTQLDQADGLLDLHGTRNEVTEAHVICEPHSFDLAQRLREDVGIVLTGMDKVMPGGTDFYMNQTGKEALCLEAGYNENRRGAVIAEVSIYDFMVARGHFPSEATVREKRWLLVDGVYQNRTADYSLARPYADFEEVGPDELIAIDGGDRVTANRDALIFYCSQKRITEPGQEAFYLAHYITPEDVKKP